MAKYVLVKDERDLIKLYQNGALNKDYGYLSEDTHKILFYENLIEENFLYCCNKFPTIFKFEGRVINHQPNDHQLWSKKKYLKWVQKCTSAEKFIKQYKEQNEKISNN